MWSQGLPGKSNSKPLILIVDDREESRELLLTYLEDEDYEIATASSGMEAVEKARVLLPRAIVTDILMPGAGGLDTIRMLKDSPQTANLPVVIVSGVDPKLLGPTPGAVAYLRKPVSKIQFLEAVRMCLSSNHPHD